MKKLMIAVATIVLAVGVNAASITWKTFAEIGNGPDADVTSATLVYLIDASALKQTAIYDSVVGGKTLDAAIGSDYVKSATLSDGKITTQTFDAFNAGDRKNFYMVLFDSNVGESGALYFSEQLEKTLLGTGTATYSFSSDSSINDIAANMTGFNATEGGWVAVPEPTSGLLLVLGMAGLMLRRRRA